MPLARETSYWDTIADKSVSTKGWQFSDNSWKRRHQLSRMMKYNWFDEKVLEIGVGNAVIGHNLARVCAGSDNYTGTELSPKFVTWGRTMYGLNVIEADLLELPGSGYTRIVAFDSLEHVRPEHREKGYANIYNVAANGALLLIHYSHGTSHHDKEFDHPYGLEDIVALEKAGFTLQTYERYNCEHPAGDIPYVFVVMKK